MGEPRTYPEGVTSWVDIETQDVANTLEFYGAIFGWTFTDATPPGSEYRYVIAQLNGKDAAGIGGPSNSTEGTASPSVWNTYVAVEDAAVAAARIAASGGQVLQGPDDAGEGGRAVVCTDPFGVRFGLWQARRRLGAQAFNIPGGWNFSILHAADPAASAEFYSTVFGWEVDDDLAANPMIRQPGYGDHLAATSDPDIYERQAAVGAPPGFADVAAGLAAAGPDEEPHWHVAFTIADRDATAKEAERLGGTVLARPDTEWTREVLIRDPQGGVFTASQFAPPSY